MGGRTAVFVRVEFVNRHTRTAVRTLATVRRARPRGRAYECWSCGAAIPYGERHFSGYNFERLCLACGPTLNGASQ
jgi:hypothetical protein